MWYGCPSKLPFSDNDFYFTYKNIYNVNTYGANGRKDKKSCATGSNTE